MLALVLLATLECPPFHGQPVTAAPSTKDDAAVVRAALDAVAPGKLLVSRLTLPCFDVSRETILKHAGAAALHEMLRQRSFERRTLASLELPPRAKRIEPRMFAVREDLEGADTAVTLALPAYSDDGKLATIALLTARHQPSGGYTENVGWNIHHLLLQLEEEGWRVIERGETSTGASNTTACPLPQPARRVKLSATDLEVIRAALTVAEFGGVLLTHETLGCFDFNPMPSALDHRAAGTLLTRLRARNAQVHLLRQLPAHRSIKFGPRTEWKHGDDLAGVRTAVTVALPSYSDDRKLAMIAMVTATPRFHMVHYDWHEMLLEHGPGGWRIARYWGGHMRGGEVL